MLWVKTEDKSVSPIIQHLKVQVIVGDSSSTLRAAGREELGIPGFPSSTDTGAALKSFQLGLVLPLQSLTNQL